MFEVYWTNPDGTKSYTICNKQEMLSIVNECDDEGLEVTWIQLP